MVVVGRIAGNGWRWEDEWKFCGNAGMKGDVINETGAIYASALLYGYEQKAFLGKEEEAGLVVLP